jgi:hypothetical protein
LELAQRLLCEAGIRQDVRLRVADLGCLGKSRRGIARQRKRLFGAAGFNQDRGA